MNARPVSLFENDRLRLKDAIDLSLDSLRAYGDRYRHWSIAYSGGKDSSATVTFTAWAIKNDLVPRPESLTVLYADTRQELPVLHGAAAKLLDHLRADGFTAQVVLPDMDSRFYVYMLGYGVPPPTNRFRWCTPKLKIEPMVKHLEKVAIENGLGSIVDGMYRGIDEDVLEGYVAYVDAKSNYRRAVLRHSKKPTQENTVLMRQALNELKDVAYSIIPIQNKLLTITGVRLGESAARDQRIAMSCSSNSGECGQGWFQEETPGSVADTLAPLLHWRLCHVFDWLYFETAKHGYSEVLKIADVYGDDDIRTGCVGCNLASRDNALERLIKNPEHAYLSPLLELKPLFAELKRPQWRLRKAEPERRKDGKLAVNGQRMGPLTLEGRAYGLERVLDIQQRARVDLINSEEESRIREMWEMGLYPNKWSKDDIAANVPVDQINVLKDGISTIVQPLLVR